MQEVFSSLSLAESRLQYFANHRKEPMCIYEVLYGRGLSQKEYSIRKVESLIDPESPRVIKVLAPEIRKPNKQALKRVEVPEKKISGEREVVVDADTMSVLYKICW